MGSGLSAWSDDEADCVSDSVELSLPPVRRERIERLVLVCTGTEYLGRCRRRSGCNSTYKISCPGGNQRASSAPRVLYLGSLATYPRVGRLGANLGRPQ